MFMGKTIQLSKLNYQCVHASIFSSVVVHTLVKGSRNRYNFFLLILWSVFGQNLSECRYFPQVDLGKFNVV